MWNVFLFDCYRARKLTCQTEAKNQAHCYHTVMECNDNIIVIFRLHDEKDEPSKPTLASVPLIHNIPELKVCQEV